MLDSKEQEIRLLVATCSYHRLETLLAWRSFLQNIAPFCNAILSACIWNPGKKSNTYLSFLAIGYEHRPEIWTRKPSSNRGAIRTEPEIDLNLRIQATLAALYLPQSACSTTGHEVHWQNLAIRHWVANRKLVWVSTSWVEFQCSLFILTTATTLKQETSASHDPSTESKGLWIKHSIIDIPWSSDDHLKGSLQRPPHSV